jgi:hypothetical protein
MTKKEKANQSWQVVRASYTWHLRPPFVQEFNRSHWWEGDSEIHPVAALYELARRHPRVGELRLKFRHARWYGQELRAPLLGDARERMVSDLSVDLEQEPWPILYLCRVGLKTWPTLGCDEQQLWKMGVGNMKGVDCRVDSEKCESVTRRAEEEATWKPLWRAYTALNVSALEEIIGSSQHGQQLIDPQDIEACIPEIASEAYRKGRWLISVAPDLAQQDAERLLASEYQKLRRQRDKARGSGKPRARVQRWVELISGFENAETGGGANANGFNPYRAALEGIQFTSSCN